jgi:ubiquinone/menaquinone biosynthesis C-methylase UbiE
MKVNKPGQSIENSKQAEHLAREREYWSACDEFEWLSEQGIQSVLNLLPPIQGDILELCSGSGMFTKRVPKQFTSYTCLDLSKSLLENLHKQLPEIIPVLGNAENPDFPSASFDMVLVFAGLHHIPDEAKVMRSAYKLLRPNGVFAAFEPNADCWYRKPMLRMKRLLKLYTEDERFLHPADIYQEMEKAQYKKIELKYLTPGYNPTHLRTTINHMLANLMRVASKLNNDPAWQSFFIIKGYK